MVVSPSDDDLVLVEWRGEFAIVTLNRPEKRNAMSRELKEALRGVFRSCHDAKVIILTGAGPAFCAGEDLVEAREERDRGERRFSHGSNLWFEVQEDIRTHPAVFIAAVNGFALGGGLTLVNNCELAIAADTAQFGMPEMSFGAFPSLAGATTIHRILPKHAAEMIFTARRIDAATALRWGIVNEVTTGTELLSRAGELAEHICQWDATLLDFGKRAYREIMRLDWSRGIEYGLATNEMIPAARGQDTTVDDAVVIGSHRIERIPPADRST